MDKKTPPPFNEFPAAAKYAVLFLLISWISHFFFFYELWLFDGRMGTDIVDRKIILQMVAICILICFFTIRVRNWARILGIMANLMAVLVYLVTAMFFGILKKPEVGLSFLAAFNAALFSASTYFLFKRKTSDFFKIHSPRLVKKEE